MMKTFVTSVVILILVFGLLTPDVCAQRGVGEPSGVARQAVKPEVVTFSGKLTEIKTGPCEKTTGRSPLGTHLILETADGKKLNIHLGPATAVADLVAKLSVGQSLTVKAFRTDKLPDGQFVAQTVTFDDNIIELRDQGLRPVWRRATLMQEVQARRWYQGVVAVALVGEDVPAVGPVGAADAELAGAAHRGRDKSPEATRDPSVRSPPSRTSRQITKGVRESAGTDRLRGVDERAIRGRNSQPPRPRVLRRRW